MLRLRLGPAAALEIPEEGPELGGRSRLIERFDDPAPRARARGLHLRGLPRLPRARARDRLARRDPAVAVETFDEVADADVWSRARIPGSPFAVALDPDGTVLAKGTFNNLAQLESVLATAERRRADSSRGG